MPRPADPALVKAVLGDAYGLDVEAMEPGGRGTVAETWIVHADGVSRFVKAIPTGRASAPVERSIPLQARLWDAGFTSMARPVATTDGRLSAVAGDHTVVVHDLIDGVATADYPFDAYVDLLAHLHATTIDVGDLVETFEDTTTLVAPFVAGLRAMQDPDATALAVKSTVDRLGPTLDEDIAEARRIQGSLAARSGLELVLTHYDAPNNVMIRPDGALVLVDWDDLLLAPRERDTWKHLIDPAKADRFLARYRLTVPAYEPDIETLHHYLLKWYFEEVEGLGGPVVDEGERPEVRARYLRWFEGAVPSYEAALRRLDRGELAWSSAVAEATSPPAQQRERQTDEQEQR